MSLPQRYLNISLLAVCLALVVALGISLKEQADLRTEVDIISSRLAEMESVTRVTGGDAGADIRDYITPTVPVVRNGAAAAVSQPPLGVDANDVGWKIWSINRWVATTVSYVSDPVTGDYYASAADTLVARAGDCDDLSILLASAFESVGLDAVIGYVDTIGDGIADHMCVLAYYPGTAVEFRGLQEQIRRALTLISPTGESTLRYVPAAGFTAITKYDHGIWLVADTSMSLSPYHVAYLKHQPYIILSAVDVGG
jgi:hypothetical protein